MKNANALKNKRVCVAASGGMDSTALLHYLKAHEQEWNMTVSAVHCEHGIRGEESLSDMRFVERLCADWDIPVYLFQENCPKRALWERVSLETAARSFRYECFEQILQDKKADCIATAHHIQDEAETVLFRMARGTSLSGAVGMYAVREGYVRPFLHWTKGEISAYVNENALPYRIDKTNEETAYTRNKIRLNVLPILEEAVPCATANIARFAALAAADDEYLYRQSKTLLKMTDAGACVKFSEEKPLFTRAALMAMKALGIDKDYTQTHLESVYRLQKSERGAYVTLPQNVIAKKGREGIVFSFLREKKTYRIPAEKPFDFEGFDGGMYEVKLSYEIPMEKGYVGKILRFDMEKLPTDAVFRFRKEGDEIEKFGGGTKSLKKYYNEEKIEIESRAYLPLIASGNGNTVYVVCGYEIAEGVKVEEETRQTVYVTLWKK